MFYILIKGFLNSIQSTVFRKRISNTYILQVQVYQEIVETAPGMDTQYPVTGTRNSYIRFME